MKYEEKMETLQFSLFVANNIFPNFFLGRSREPEVSGKFFQFVELSLN